MPNKSPEMIIYFDESGNTGDDLNNDEQGNLFLAGVAIPQANSSFWDAAEDIWHTAEVVLRKPPGSVELKASQIYGGWKTYEGTSSDDRLKILDSVADCLIRHRIEILWDGLPKYRWVEKIRNLPQETMLPFWERVLFAFCDELQFAASTRYGVRSLRIVGDENSWVHVKQRLVLPGRWDYLLDRGILFENSQETRGLQLADVVVHTLYRANKQQVPNPDRELRNSSEADHLAQKIHRKLAQAGLWVNLTEVRNSKNHD